MEPKVYVLVSAVAVIVNTVIVGVSRHCHGARSDGRETRDAWQVQDQDTT